MNKLILTLFFTLFLLITKGQDNDTPIGYRLRKGDQVIKVYQDNKGEPDTSIYNLWIYNYWFKKDGDTKELNGVKYLKITIPGKFKWKDSLHKYDNLYYDKPKEKWTQEGAPVDVDDLNSWLWIKESDFKDYSYSYYGKINKQFVFSGLTAPYRYRPKSGSSPNILTGDVNLGTFIGFRIYSPYKTGLSLGASGGLASFNQNPTNNTASYINNQAITGFTYGFVAVIDWQKKFQVGAVYGFDHGVGDLSKTYIYQNKPWVALSLNYQFLDFGKAKLDQTADMKGKK
jgi:hypothetical protein